MKRIGAIILSFEEADDLADLKPWKDAADSLPALSSVPISGLVSLSTCNRVEFIYSLSSSVGSSSGSSVEQQNGSSSDTVSHELVRERFLELLPTLAPGVRPVFLHGREAVRHLLRLAAGLESMIVGETEIRAQMKQAFEKAGENDLLDQPLRLLFHRIFQEARAVRSAIPLGRLPLSVATLSIRKLKDRLADSATGAVVVIGSGPMSRQSAQYLSKWAPRIVLVNRTVSKIESVGRELGAQVLSFDDFMRNPAEAGPIAAVVTATSRSDAFITPELIARFQREENRDGGGSPRPLVLVDLALPADVDERCMGRDGIDIISLETLRVELDQNRRKREEAAAAAAAPVQAALLRVEAEFISAVSAPIIKTIQKDVRDQSRMHLEQLLDDRLSHLAEKDKRLLYNWAIQANKDLNRIHRRGMESVLRNYFAEEGDHHSREAGVSHERTGAPEASSQAL